jgi:hypothetical protein
MVVCSDDGMEESRFATFPRSKEKASRTVAKHSVRVRVPWCQRQISSDRQTLYQHRTSMAVAVTGLVSPTWM